MVRYQFSKIVRAINDLTRHQQNHLFDELKSTLHHNKVVQTLEERLEKTNQCPHCESSSFSRWGQAHQLQRYRCQHCKKTFNALTGSPLAKLRNKEKWLDYAQCLSQNQSIREAAKSCSIDKTTSFRWRHRFLENSSQAKSPEFSGIVEVDETFFAVSEKGSRTLSRSARQRGGVDKRERDQRVPVVILRDRTGAMADFVLNYNEKEEIHDCLLGLIRRESVLCSDGNEAYRSLAEKENIPHQPVIAKAKRRVVDDIFHIQNVNGVIQRLKNWLVRFNGVATRYLESYLGWRRFIESKDHAKDPIAYLQAAIG